MALRGADGEERGNLGQRPEINVWDAEEDAFIEDEQQTILNDGDAVTLNHHPVTPSARNRIHLTRAANGLTTSLRIITTGPPAAGEVAINPATGDLTFSAADPLKAGDKVTAAYLVSWANAVENEEHTVANDGDAVTFT